MTNRQRVPTRQNGNVVPAAKKAPAKKATKRTAPLSDAQRIAQLERELEQLKADVRVDTWLLAQLLNGMRVAAVAQQLRSEEAQQAIAQQIADGRIQVQ